MLNQDSRIDCISPTRPRITTILQPDRELPSLMHSQQYCREMGMRRISLCAPAFLENVKRLDRELWLPLHQRSGP